MLNFDKEQKIELIKRLHGKYDVKSSGCWEWNRSFTKGGYPIYRAFCIHTTAHRISYAIFNGDIDDGMEIDHLCKNIKCVNPNHLEQVTRKENVKRSYKPMQSHCVNGHIFDEKNTYLKPSNGTRACRKCNKIRAKKNRILTTKIGELK